MMNDDALWADIEAAFDELSKPSGNGHWEIADILDSPDELWSNPDPTELDIFLAPSEINTRLKRNDV